MISPLTMLVVLATTLTIASPLPEPKSAAHSISTITTSDKRPLTSSSAVAPKSRLTSTSSVDKHHATTSSTAAPKKTGTVSHGLVKAGTEKIVDLNCVGTVDSNGKIHTLCFHLDFTNVICKRRR